MSQEKGESVESQAAAPVDVAPPTAANIDEPNIDEPEFVDPVDLPPGWKYKRFSLFGFQFPWYASPKVQLLMVSFVCFMCPGMFNALGGLGGGGKINPTLADNMVSRRLCFETLGHYANRRRNRILPSTVLSLSSDSLVEPSSIRSV